jgi:hypothetical protein
LGAIMLFCTRSALPIKFKDFGTIKIHSPAVGA